MYLFSFGRLQSLCPFSSHCSLFKTFLHLYRKHVWTLAPRNDFLKRQVKKGSCFSGPFVDSRLVDFTFRLQTCRPYLWTPDITEPGLTSVLRCEHWLTTVHVRQKFMVQRICDTFIIHLLRIWTTMSFCWKLAGDDVSREWQSIILISLKYDT